MTALIFHIIAWPTFAMALLVFGFAPGAALRLIVLAYKRDNPRRRELAAELHNVPRIERPFWVAEQLELAIFEGLLGRLAVRRMKRKWEISFFGRRSFIVNEEGVFNRARNGCLHEVDHAVARYVLQDLADDGCLFAALPASIRKAVHDSFMNDDIGKSKSLRIGMRVQVFSSTTVDA